MKEGKANRTIYPDGTVGVYFRMDEVDYQKFVEKCDRDGLKIKKTIEKLIKKFTK